MEADKGRVDTLHDRVIDLKVADDIDPLRFHCIDSTTAHKCTKRSAVPIGRHGNFTFFSKKNLALIIDGRDETLHDEMDGFTRKSKKISRFECSHCGVVVDLTGQNIPWDRHVKTFARAGNLFSEHLKECLFSDRSHRVSALGAIVTEARTLTTCHGKGCHTTSPQGS